ncbi:MAG: site-2 protease family protein [Candidatus Woesearchaeota archaeon]
MTLIQTTLTFLSSWKFVLFFYIILAIVIYFNRKKFQIESGFILLYKTKFGIEFMDRFAKKHKELLKIVGYVAIGVGFIGMLAISGLLIKGLYDLIFVPAAPPTLSLVIPGVQIPGSPIFIPFWYGIIALFIVIVFHEFGHGIIAKAHGLDIKSTGFGFFGPLPLAFVEPDEKQVIKKDSVVQHSIFAAGPFFNVILVGIVLLISLFILNPIISTMVTPQGVSFTNIQENYPAAQYGVEKNIAYNMVNGVEVKDSQEFVKTLSCVAPNDTIILGNKDKNLSIVAGVNPSDSTKGYLGVSGITTDYKLKSEAVWFKGTYYLLFMFATLLEWVATLSLGIGLANLLPLGPVDGGRMINKASIDINGKKKGTHIWATITIITLITMAILIFVPIIKDIFFKI